MEEILNTNSMAGPIIITALYLLVWYYFLFIVQRGTKYRLQAEYKKSGKEFNRYFGQDEEMLAADRLVINTQEQMIPFLVSFWLYSIFVTPTNAMWLGGAYIILRLIYPHLLGKKISNVQPKRVYFVTIPSYLIIFFMLGNVVWTIFK